jgi:hypothetical protein
MKILAKAEEQTSWNLKKRSMKPKALEECVIVFEVRLPSRFASSSL